MILINSITDLLDIGIYAHDFQKVMSEIGLELMKINFITRKPM